MLRLSSVVRCTCRSVIAVADLLGQLDEDVLLRRVADRVDRVQAQPVEPVLLEPVERVLDREAAHRLPRS